VRGKPATLIDTAETSWNLAGKCNNAVQASLFLQEVGEPTPALPRHPSEEGIFRRLCCRVAEPHSMKILLPSLDKEGQTAASGCCRGGSKPLRAQSVALVLSPATTPLGLRPSIPSSAEAGSLFSRENPS
jgi:hypothetical protein